MNRRYYHALCIALLICVGVVISSLLQENIAFGHTFSLTPAFYLLSERDETISSDHIVLGQAIKISGKLVSISNKTMTISMSIFDGRESIKIGSDGLNWKVLRIMPNEAFIIKPNETKEFSIELKSLKVGVYHIHPVFKIVGSTDRLGVGQAVTVLPEGEWKVYKVNVKDQVFKIPYKITNGTIKSIIAYPDNAGVIINLESQSKTAGIIEITLPRDLTDLVEIDEKGFGGGSSDIWVEGSQQITISSHNTIQQDMTFEEVNSSPCFHTFAVNLPVGSERIMVATAVIPEGTYEKVVVPPVNITTDKNNYELGETITLSGCTSLALDDKNVILSLLEESSSLVIDTNVTPNPDGSFSYTLCVQCGIDTIGGKAGSVVNGTYVVRATYAGHSATTSFVIPEFPVFGVIILAISISFILAIRLKTPKFKRAE